MITTTIFRHGSASVRLHSWNDGTAAVSNLYARKKNCGDGTKVMRQLTKYADKENLILYLTAQPYGPHTDLDYKRLVNFYRRFRFRVIIQGTPSMMKRRPSQKKLGV